MLLGYLIFGVGILTGIGFAVCLVGILHQSYGCQWLFGKGHACLSAD